MINIKYINLGQGSYPDGKGPTYEFDGCRFIMDAACREYDWLVVFDDFPRKDMGSIVREAEPLACPREKTILVTQEPPSIKIYPQRYTRQYGYVLTTHLPQHLPHPHHRIGRGCVHWMADYPIDEAFSAPDYPKSKVLSTVCSAKQMKHTEHNNRYRLTRYVADRLPELDWYGRGVRDLKKKYEALNDYKYHIAVENYIRDYHWTDKISDPLLGLCLTFYAGDPKLGEVLPPESFIPIPLDKPEEALNIIRTAIANNEYEKRLPAIREARRRILEQYNFFFQVTATIRAHEEAEARGLIPQAEKKPFVLRGRHAMRRRGLNALAEAWESNAYKLSAKLSGHDHVGRAKAEEKPQRLVQLHGDSGQQMLQYAFAKAVEAQTRAEVCLIPDAAQPQALSAFPLSLRTATAGEQRRARRGKGLLGCLGIAAPVLTPQKADLMLNALPSLPPHAVLAWEHPPFSYADSVREALLRDFDTAAAEAALSPEAAAALAAVRAAGGAAVAVHLSRTLAAAYYTAALDRQPADSPLLVLTDDAALVREKLGDRAATVVCTADALTRLILSRACRRHIADDSVLSLWGAWLAPSETAIAPACFADAACPGLLPAAWKTL